MSALTLKLETQNEIVAEKIKIDPSKGLIATFDRNQVFIHNMLFNPRTLELYFIDVTTRSNLYSLTHKKMIRSIQSNADLDNHILISKKKIKHGYSNATENQDAINKTLNNRSGLLSIKPAMNKTNGAKTHSELLHHNVHKILSVSNLIYKPETTLKRISFIVLTSKNDDKLHIKDCLKALSKHLPVSIPSKDLPKIMKHFYDEGMITKLSSVGEYSGSLFKVNRDDFFSNLLPSIYQNINIKNIDMGEFMEKFGQSAIENATQKLQPVHTQNNQDDEDSLKVLRRDPYPSQKKAIHAAVQGFRKGLKSIWIAMEMGTGKSITSIAISKLMNSKTSLVLSPPQLIKKWAREIKSTLSNVKVVNLNSWAATGYILHHKNGFNNAIPTYFLIGRVRNRMEETTVAAYSFKTDYKIKLRCKMRLKSSQRELIKAKLTSASNAKIKEIKIQTDKIQHELKTTPYMALCMSCHKNLEVLKDTITINGDGLTIKKKEWVSAQIDEVDKDSVCKHCESKQFQFAHKNPKDKNLSAQRNRMMVKWLSDIPNVSDNKAREVLFAMDIDSLAKQLQESDYQELLEVLFKPNSRSLKKAKEYLDEAIFTLTPSDIPPYKAFKRMRKNTIESLIADEVHEAKSDSSSQGIAFGTLAQVCKRSLCLSGSIMGGFASDLHALLFRSDPAHMKSRGYPFNSTSRYQAQEGVIEKTSSKASKKTIKTKKVPGYSAVAVAKDILPRAIFIRMKEISHDVMSLAKKYGGSLNIMPSYRETFVSITMDDDQAGIYHENLSKSQADLLDGDNKKRSQAIIGLLAALDRPDQETYSGSVFVPAWLKNEGDITPKESEMVKIVKRDVANDRKCLIYVNFTNKLDCQPRMKKVLENAGIKTAILRASTGSSAADRESWIDKQVADGVVAIITHPMTVMTGLDLDFPTIINMQTVDSTFVLRQANRRSWRIGLTKPVRVYYLAYDKSAQSIKLSFMAKKIRTSMDTDGNVDESALDGLLDDDDSSLAAIARALTSDDETSSTSLPDSIKTVDHEDLSHDYHADIDHLPTEEEIKSMFKKNDTNMDLTGFFN